MIGRWPLDSNTYPGPPKPSTSNRQALTLMAGHLIGAGHYLGVVMSRGKCTSCDNDVQSSQKLIDNSGLSTGPEWGKYLERSGWRCSKCLGTNTCVNCGVSLWQNGWYDIANYCGQPTCITCTKNILKGRLTAPPSLVGSNTKVNVTVSSPRRSIISRFLGVILIGCIWFALTILWTLWAASGNNTAETETFSFVGWALATLYALWRIFRMLFKGR